MIQKYKKPILIIVGIAVLFVVYVLFFTQEREPVLSTTSAQTLSPENNELIALLSQLNSIRLERDIFSNEVLRSLFDFSVVLIPEPVSRPNPFAPIGSEGALPVIQTQQVDIGAVL